MQARGGITRRQKVDKKILTKKSEKGKFKEGLISRKKKDALEFIRSLTAKQVGEVLGEGDVMYNDRLDAFFVWRDGRLVMYVNEAELDRGGRGLGMDRSPQYVEQREGEDIHYCERCKMAILDPGFIRLEDGREFHYNPKCWPTKATTVIKE